MQLGRVWYDKDGLIHFDDGTHWVKPNDESYDDPTTSQATFTTSTFGALDPVWDFDGIVNFLEFVLGGNPLVASSAILPTIGAPTGGTWSFEYDRSNLSAPPATTQVVEYTTNLGDWTEVPVPLTSAGTVTITPGSPSDHVSVAIPDLGEAGFARLKVTE